MKSVKSFRLSKQALADLAGLANRRGASEAEIITIAIDRMHREETTMRDTLTTEQKEAALFARNANDSASAEKIMTLEWIRSMSENEEDEATMIAQFQAGSAILEQYTLHRFESHQALSIAQEDAENLVNRGYETLIVDRETFGNRYDMIALRRK